jgi:hypothetical protein
MRWQTAPSFDAGTAVLVTWFFAGAGLALTVIRPTTNATLSKRTMATAEKRIRSPWPVVWMTWGAAVEDMVTVTPFKIRSGRQPQWRSRPYLYLRL